MRKTLCAFTIRLKENSPYLPQAMHACCLQAVPLPKQNKLLERRSRNSQASESWLPLAVHRISAAEETLEPTHLYRERHGNSVVAGWPLGKRGGDQRCDLHTPSSSLSARVASTLHTCRAARQLLRILPTANIQHAIDAHQGHQSRIMYRNVPQSPRNLQHEACCSGLQSPTTHWSQPGGLRVIWTNQSRIQEVIALPWIF